MCRFFQCLSVATILILPALVGCGSSAGSRLLGKWELDANKSIDDATAGGSQPGGAFAAGLMKEMAKSIKVEVEFKPGGALSLNTSTVLVNAEAKNGTWRVARSSGNDITVAFKLDGETAEREMSIKVMDKDTLEMVPPTAVGPKSPATFRRAKKT